jgi:hypothetical protein
MERRLWTWIGTQLGDPTGHAPASRLVGLVDTFEVARRAQVPLTQFFESDGVKGLKLRWDGVDDVIPFVDFLVAVVSADVLGDTKLAVLEDILATSGSAWKVGNRDGHPGLERRVPVGVQEVADHVMNVAGDAGRRLSEAWHAVFGVNPDPSKAYGLAIKAVEDAAKPVVTPKDRLATLGKMNNVVRDQGWSLPLQREDPNSPTSEVLLGMMRALWSGQVDRHGGSDESEHCVTQVAAESAVLLAVPLVQWFSSGAAHQAPKAGR